MKFMKDKIGQMKIQEMAFVLIAFIFLLGLLLLFFARFQMTQIQDISDQIRIVRGQNMLQYVANLPELNCPSSFSGLAGKSCIDYDKLKIFATKKEISDKYENVFASAYLSKIEINVVFPTNETIILYKASEEKNVQTFKTYIPICEENQQESNCKIGIVKIGIETS